MEKPDFPNLKPSKIFMITVFYTKQLVMWVYMGDSDKYSSEARSLTRPKPESTKA